MKRFLLVSTLAVNYRVVDARGATYLRANDSTLLTHFPMIMTHDAGSGYLDSSLVDRWAKTQDGGLAEQLECGARAFDARPHNSLTDGLQWHHGDVVVAHQFDHSLEEMIQWLASHPTELATLHIWDCAGDGCESAVLAVLTNRNITTIADCARLQTLMYGEAKEIGALAGGGSLLALTGSSGCSQDNYDPSIACSGYTSGDSDDSKRNDTRESGLPREYGCWITDESRALPVDRIFSYLDEVAALGLREDRFMQMQGLWQESGASVVIGARRNSSLLLDESRSNLNGKLVDAVRQGRWSSIGLLEVNNVCDHGNALLDALRGRD